MSLKVKALVLLAAGINCDRETTLAFELAGAVPHRVHINDLIANPKLLADYQILALPGGFSFGDDIASGQVLAWYLKNRLAAELKSFIDEDKLIIGICNGFQVLIKLGLLPALGKDYSRQQATLSFNTSAKFEDRWVYLKPDPNCRSIFTNNLEKLVYLPVRHGKGRFMADEQIMNDLKSSGQIALRYVDSEGSFGEYPANPNGSIDNIAGLCDPTGRVFGMMPHPEVFVRLTQHPRWTRGQRPTPTGLKIFKNAVDFSLNS
ncbi:MAG TPA: phosphoribosylformylglycinamidine synthase I [Actinobacteria bacterium]|nr:phosphoribosylformylglycinamidine synthase I [Actinomycetota bacterium]